MSTSLKDLKGKVVRALGALSWEKPPTREAANAMVDRFGFSKLLPYRSFDPKNEFIYTDDGKRPYVTFGLQIQPLLVAGRDIEEPLEAVINACAPDTVLQFAMHAHDDVKWILDQWLETRIAKNDNPLLQEMARRRHQHFLDSVWEKSATRVDRMHPRQHDAYLFVTVPYKGNMDNPKELGEWIEKTSELRKTVSGKLEGSKLRNQRVTEVHFRHLMRMLLNPNFTPVELADRESDAAKLPGKLVEKETRVRVDDRGLIHFEGGSRDAACAVMSVDSYPEEHDLPSMRQLMGDITARDEKIPCTFWAYTMVHVLDRDDARDQLTTRLGIISKQTLSESEWYRSMQAHLYTRRDDTQHLLEITRRKHAPVRIMTAMAMYGVPDAVVQDSETVAGMWAKAAFAVSPERYISMPMFIAGLPGCYRPEWDDGVKGLQRMTMMHSFNAATMAWVGADWSGTNPAKGGLLLMSRRGQVGCINFFESDTNKNAVITATSGGGKSFLTVDLVAYILALDGIVYMIDKGGSYRRLNQLLDGQEIRFNPNDPKSINPFWGIETERDFQESFRMLAEVIKLMCFPGQTPPAWENRLIETLLKEAWQKHGAKLETIHIQEAFRNYEDEAGRARDLADQMEPFCHGIYAIWFNGEREVHFNSHFVVVEMDELDADRELRTLVLSLTVNMITREMYLKNAGKFKLLGIDEAWDLLADPKAAGFVETAARKIRKYLGMLLTISQSCLDYKKSEAALAAMSNSAWKILMYQQGSSLDYAREVGVIPEGDEACYRAACSVQPSKAFSEFMVIHTMGREAFRYVVDPYTYWVSTTDGEDKAKIEEFQVQLDEKYRELEAKKIQQERDRGLEISQEAEAKRIEAVRAPIHIVLKAITDGLEGLDLEHS